MSNNRSIDDSSGQHELLLEAECDGDEEDAAAESAEQAESSVFTRINDSSRIIRASWHQKNKKIFKSSYAGVQCCAMALANILRAAILPPEQWSSNVLDENLIEGDRCYGIILERTTMTDAYRIPENGYLEIKNFDIIKNEIIMYSNNFSLVYDDSAPIFGLLKDNSITEDFCYRLKDGLHSLLQYFSSGILITNGTSYAILKDCNAKFYFVDSHSCGPKGAPASAKGKACMIQCDTIDELHRICKRATGSREQFDIHPIRVVVKSGDVSESSLPNNAVVENEQDCLSHIRNCVIASEAQS